MNEKTLCEICNSAEYDYTVTDVEGEIILICNPCNVNYAGEIPNYAKLEGE